MLKFWHRYIKKTTRTYGFLDNPHVESSTKCVSSISKGWYFCRLNNHTHESYGLLQEYKWLALVAKSTSTENTSTIWANVVKEENANTDDNITNDNIKYYVDTIINTISKWKKG